MKFLNILLVLSLLVCLLASCGKIQNKSDSGAVEICLSDEKITVDGKEIKTESENAVYKANDIIYYESGKDFIYGEGSEKDAHSVEEASAHTVVHITKAGKYSISGKLSKGQIAVDLGDGAKENPESVVTLILDGVDITNTVAPAIIFYNVYECGEDDTHKASNEVDTSGAGANVIIADGTTNTVNGSYVEKIYKPDSVVLNEDKTKVEDAEKLHKYDGAFYSKMSMNIYGDKNNSGILNINAQNEGLDSELHLTVNGGIININSGNDGINTNEDGVSVTTVNDGVLTIKVTGDTGEGDGIDSNGWLVINGGKVVAEACSESADAGIDSDKGIHINGGTVIAGGSMLDRIEDGGQTYAVFNFASKQSGKEKITLKSKEDKVILETTLQNAYSVLIYSSPDLKEGIYSLWSADKQLAYQSGGIMGGGMRPNGMTPPEGFETPNEKPDFQGEAPQKGERPWGDFERPEGIDPPQGNERPERPEDNQNPNGDFNSNDNNTTELTTEFEIHNGANMFGRISFVNSQ